MGARLSRWRGKKKRLGIDDARLMIEDGVASQQVIIRQLESESCASLVMARQARYQNRRDAAAFHMRVYKMRMSQIRKQYDTLFQQQKTLDFLRIASHLPEQIEILRACHEILVDPELHTGTNPSEITTLSAEIEAGQQELEASQVALGAQATPIQSDMDLLRELDDMINEPDGNDMSVVASAATTPLTTAAARSMESVLPSAPIAPTSFKSRQHIKLDPSPPHISETQPLLV